MCGNFVRSERIELVDGMLWRYIYCEGKKPEFLVAKVCEDGKQMSRNIEYCGMYGWRYIEPGRDYRDYYGKFVAKVDEWGDFTPSLDNFCIEFPSEKDKKTILSKYPDFKWVLKKTDWSITQIFKALTLWKKEARLMDTLCSIGCQDLALNGSFYKAVDRWDIVKWLSHNEQHRRKSLEDIRLMRKFGVEWEVIKQYRYKIHRHNYVSFEEWRYLQGKPKYQDEYFYNDYRKKCKEVGHDFKDPYWHFPKNLKKQHDKVMKEVALKRAAEEAIRRAKAAEEKARKEKERATIYTKFVKMMAKYIGRLTEGAIEVFVPKSVELVQKQAKDLHQCLIAADYISKIVAKKCLLVFLYKDGKPYATAELRTKGRKFELGQFNRNQQKKEIHATEADKEILMKWAKENNVKMVA